MANLGHPTSSASGARALSMLCCSAKCLGFGTTTAHRMQPWWGYRRPRPLSHEQCPCVFQTGHNCLPRWPRLSTPWRPDTAPCRLETLELKRDLAGEMDASKKHLRLFTTFEQDGTKTPPQELGAGAGAGSSAAGWGSCHLLTQPGTPLELAMLGWRTADPTPSPQYGVDDLAVLFRDHLMPSWAYCTRLLPGYAHSHKVRRPTSQAQGAAQQAGPVKSRSGPSPPCQRSAHLSAARRMRRRGRSIRGWACLGSAAGQTRALGGWSPRSGRRSSWSTSARSSFWGRDTRRCPTGAPRSMWR